ncbi:DNA methylase [Streptomyces libani subsp. rufus]|nr:DNA methylase [Streptomyces libani subsp. rufus]
MIDRKSLLSDLQKQVKAAETDLDAQVKAVPEVGARLRGEYDQAKKLGRTAATWNSWLGERVTQVAVAWVLGTVFVRFSEDNRLIAEPYITAPDVAGREVAQARYEEYMAKDADPTYRGWLETAFAELGAGQAGRLLFDRDHNPLYQIPLSHDGAGALLAFWREQKSVEAEGGSGSTSVLVHDFTDPLSEGGTAGWDTRFLGDLYQDLSEAARKTYALLQTPEFVEEFILDRTMTPAVREFGFAELKMIDPTCGSGHFVLGAFRRLVRLWAEERPEVGSYERVRAALESVHGVDLNPFAVAVARFRLLVAAMAASGMRTFAAAREFEWPIQLAVGDSLIKDRQLELQLGLGEESAAGDPLAEFSYATEDVQEYPGILKEGRYHVVVGNPPYITVKDKNLNSLYKGLYDACAGTYALSVPFAQRFFELAVRGDQKTGRGFGLVGQITANSFMKREFGTKLIESFFRDRVELTEVIDTSGAYIPGHGTPTVILIGRPLGHTGTRQSTIRAVRSVQGEPAAPMVPAEGSVWRAIVDQIDRPGSTGRWVSVDDLERGQNFGKQPWVLVDGGLEMKAAIGRASVTTLGQIAKSIGFSCVTREDDAYMLGTEAARRLRTPKEHIRTFHGGSSIRDWTKTDGVGTLFPYLEETKEAGIPEPVEHILWPNRTNLRNRRALSGTQEEQGLEWFEYSSFNRKRHWSKFLIAFSFVATHGSFTLRRDRDAFIRSAPVITLPEEATEEEYLQLLGLLNSSTAGLWLKMVSHDKGSQSGTGGFMHDEWERFYEFTGTKLQEFPIPSEHPISLATKLDSLAQQLSAAAPRIVVTKTVPAAPELRDARSHYESIRARMIALQEELDWQVYSLYKLHSDDLHLPNTSDVPEIALGERAFEIVLARRVASGEVEEVWFKRHGSTPITEIPSHWPDDYRALVQKRIDVIESNRAIGMIERPEYKRRWATEGWDSMKQKALKSWLLDRIEDRSYWFDASGNPTVTTLTRLTEALSADEDFTSVADLYAPGRTSPRPSASCCPRSTSPSYRPSATSPPRSRSGPTGSTSGIFSARRTPRRTSPPSGRSGSERPYRRSTRRPTSSSPVTGAPAASSMCPRSGSSRTAR